MRHGCETTTAVHRILNLKVTIDTAHFMIPTAFESSDAQRGLTFKRWKKQPQRLQFSRNQMLVLFNIFH